MRNQSGVVFGFIFVAFVIFITSRGELPDYANVFFGASKSGSRAGSGAGSGTAPNTPAPQSGGLGGAVERLGTRLGEHVRDSAWDALKKTLGF